MKPGEFIDWLHIVEKVFNYKEASEVHRVNFVAIKLRKYASLLAREEL